MKKVPIQLLAIFKRALERVNAESNFDFRIVIFIITILITIIIAIFAFEDLINDMFYSGGTVDLPFIRLQITALMVALGFIYYKVLPIKFRKFLMLFIASTIFIRIIFMIGNQIMQAPLPIKSNDSWYQLKMKWSRSTVYTSENCTEVGSNFVYSVRNKWVDEGKDIIEKDGRNGKKNYLGYKWENNMERLFTYKDMILGGSEEYFRSKMDCVNRYKEKTVSSDDYK